MAVIKRRLTIAGLLAERNRNTTSMNLPMGVWIRSETALQRSVLSCYSPCSNQAANTTGSEFFSRLDTIRQTLPKTGSMNCRLAFQSTGMSHRGRRLPSFDRSSAHILIPRYSSRPTPATRKAQNSIKSIFLLTLY